jgi:Ni/Co efflux regulator RcnB
MNVRPPARVRGCGTICAMFHTSLRKPIKGLLLALVTVAVLAPGAEAAQTAPTPGKRAAAADPSSATTTRKARKHRKRKAARRSAKKNARRKPSTSPH